MSHLRLRYQTIEFADLDIHLRTLRDNQQYSDPFGEAEALGISSAQWPLFGVLWDAGIVLAQEMLTKNIAGKRILEVGCGMALASLVLNSRQADITATDYHPEAGNFLTENTRLNQSDAIPYLQTDWQSEQDGLGLFDLIIGADLLYEREHIGLLSNFIERHAKADCEVILTDPGRGNHARFSKRMEDLGYCHSQRPANEDQLPATAFKGQILNYQRNASV